MNIEHTNPAAKVNGIATLPLFVAAKYNPLLSSNIEPLALVLCFLKDAGPVLRGEVVQHRELKFNREYIVMIAPNSRARKERKERGEVKGKYEGT